MTTGGASRGNAKRETLRAPRSAEVPAGPSSVWPWRRSGYLANQCAPYLPAAAIDLGKAPMPAKDLPHSLGTLGYGEQRQLPGELDGGSMTHLRAGQRVQGSPEQHPLGARRCGER